jgi:hypothetical protein
MSGSMNFGMSIYWDRNIRSGVSAAAFFWEWMKFIHSHGGMTWKGYGSGKSQSGTEPPAAWLNWDPAVSAPPWGDNSWIVWGADNADSRLTGEGNMPWQCKLQYTGSTAFDDCNVADVDYTKEGDLYAVIGRVSCMGGWNQTTLDFSPTGGEAASDNNRWWGGTAATGQNEFFNLEIVGDDDTIFWNGCGYDSPIYPEIAWQNRGGYLGMLQRRSPDITYPFFHKVGRLGDIGYGAGEQSYNTRNTYEWSPGDAIDWPSYSLWMDGTSVTAHMQDTWDGTTLSYISRHIESGEDLVLNMLVAQWQTPARYAVLGEYRLIGAVGYDWGFHEVRGTTPPWFQFCYDPASYGGVAMRWKPGETPIW